MPQRHCTKKRHTSTHITAKHEQSGTDFHSMSRSDESTSSKREKRCGAKKQRSVLLSWMRGAGRIQCQTVNWVGTAPRSFEISPSVLTCNVRFKDAAYGLLGSYLHLPAALSNALHGPCVSLAVGVDEAPGAISVHTASDTTRPVTEKVPVT